MNTQIELDMEQVKEFVGDFNKLFNDLEAWTKNAIQIKAWKDYFLKKYPKIFNDSSEKEVEMDTDEGKTRPKKPNLAEIREKLPCKRTAEKFTDYDGLMSDSTLSLVQKIVKLQKAIDHATRRKIHFVLQEELLQSCFEKLKEAYKRTLEQINIKKQWALFLRKLYKLVLEYNQLAYCTVSLRFICYNFKAIEEICKSEPDNWK